MMSGVSIEKTVEKLASDLLQIAKQLQPPVNLFSLFPYRRILRAVPSENQDIEGMLRVDKKGFTILYRPSHKVRERFTIAHEIGHTFFYDVQGSPPARLSPSPFPLGDEQRICDLIASELIMPRGWLLRGMEQVDRRRERAPHPDVLMSLARTYFVSVPAMARRLVQELNVWDVVVLCAAWLPKRHDEQRASSWAWRAIWGYAPAQYKGVLFLPPFTELPRIRFQAAQEALERLLQHKTPNPEPYTEPLSRFSLGNLAKVLRSRIPDCKSYPVYTACYAREPMKLFDDSDMPLPPETKGTRQAYQVLLCIPLASQFPTSVTVPNHYSS